MSGGLVVRRRIAALWWRGSSHGRGARGGQVLRVVEGCHLADGDEVVDALCSCAGELLRGLRRKVVVKKVCRGGIVCIGESRLEMEGGDGVVGGGYISFSISPFVLSFFFFAVAVIDYCRRRSVSEW